MYKRLSMPVDRECIAELLATSGIWTPDMTQKLKAIYDETNDPSSKFYQIERGGKLMLDLNDDGELRVVDVDLFAVGESAVFVYPEYHPFVFHCHPKSSTGLFDFQPPSGTDLANAIMWGGLDSMEYTKADQTVTMLDVIAEAHGLWTIRKHEDLVRLYLKYWSDGDPDRMNILYLLIEFYATACDILLQNDCIDVERYIESLKVIDIRYLANKLAQNVPLQEYIQSQVTKEMSHLTVNQFLEYTADSDKYVSVIEALEALPACFEITLHPWFND